VFATIDAPAFLGVQSAVADIDRVRFSVISLTDADPQDGFDPFDGFALNQVDFLKDTVVRVPDASALGSIAAAVWLLLLAAGRHRQNG